jgi:predicted nucleic acid-binding protein
MEYEDVFGRPALWKKSLLDEKGRMAVFDAFLASAAWTEVYFLWRPNLRDEGDNFIIETAVAGGATAIVTRDVRDLRSGELRFPDLAILTPEQLLERFPCRP